MIVLTVIVLVVPFLLSLIPALDISFTFFSGIKFVTDIFAVIAYILPWQAILPLILLNISIFVFRVIIALIKTIWELLPIA